MITNVFDEIASFEGLMQANHDISAGRRYLHEELVFWDHLEENVHTISDMLYDGKVPKDYYYTFFVYEPKLRKIVCSDYWTKLVNRSIYNAIAPRINKTFITDTYACIPERGNLNAVLRLQQWVDYVDASGKKWFYLKGDARKFFYRMDHDILMNRYGRKIKPGMTMALLTHYVCHASKAFGIPIWCTNPMDLTEDQMLWDVGVAIGGGLGHLHGNLYLDPLDQYCKHDLRIKYYIRGMDDFIALSDDKDEIHYWLDSIREFMDRELKLMLNEKTCIRPINQGIEFLGYRIWPHYHTLRKSTSLRMKRRMSAVEVKYNNYEMTLARANQTVQSYAAMLKHCNCTSLQKSVFQNFVLTHRDLKEAKRELQAERS